MRASFSGQTAHHFDRFVGLIILLLLVAIGLVIWRGDQLQLQIVTITPGASAVDVPTRTQVQIRFDQPIAQPMTNEWLSFTPPLDGALQVSDHTLTFIPATPLQPHTAYTVTLKPGVLGQRGGQLRRATTWHFRTSGVQIVFSTLDAEGKEQLYLTPAQIDTPDPQAATPTQLTTLNNSLWEFAVAPDSSRIVFSALKEDGTSDLWQIRPGEQEPALLLACPNAVCSSVAWSADGRTLAFSRRNATQFSTATLSPPRLWLLDVASGDSFPAFADDQKLAFEPRWSADGQWISYVSPDLGGIGLYQLSSEQEAFYPTTTGEPAPWHPQDTAVLLSVDLQLGEAYASHLQLIDPVSQTMTDLSGAEKIVEDGSPAWSPDGEWIAFRRKEVSGPGATPGKQLWRMRGDGSEAVALTAEAEFDFGPPAWSTDGRYLLFHKLPLRGPDITFSVWVMEVESGRAWQIANPGQRPQWFP